MSKSHLQEATAILPHAGRGVFPARLQSSPTPAMCRMVVIFDDQESRNRATCLAENLHRSVGGEVEFVESWWKFSLLREHGMASLAADDATGADLILFSFGEGNDLPPAIMAFNDLWIKRREGREGLLGILLHQSTISITRIESLRKYFNRLARHARLDFITNFDHPTLRRSGPPQIPRLDRERVLKPLCDEYFCPTNSFAS